MHLHRGPFLWPWWCAGAIRSTSPDAAWPGLHPLDAVSGKLLAPYRPGGHQGNNQHNNDAACTHFAGCFDGRHNAAVLYREHRPMEEVHGFHIATKRRHRVSTHSDITNQTCPTLVDSDISSWKRAPVDMLAPNNYRCMPYQTDLTNLNIMVEYSVGVVKIACFCINTHLLLHVFLNNLIKYLSNWTS